MHRESIAWLVLSCLLALLAGNARAEFSSLPPGEFLAAVRQPFRQDAWGEITGRLTHIQNSARQRGTVRIRLAFSPAALHAQVVVNETNVYGYEQHHGVGEIPESIFDLPETEEPPGLADYGIQPEDVTFAFVYWNFLRELPEERFRQRRCRVFELRHPEEEKGTVRVWFDSARGFPLQAQWFRPDEATPWRTLELKGARRHADDLWFVKEMRLEGADWKTQVIFDHAEINPVERTAPEPAALPEAQERN